MLPMYRQWDKKAHEQESASLLLSILRTKSEGIVTVKGETKRRKIKRRTNNVGVSEQEAGDNIYGLMTISERSYMSLWERKWEETDIWAYYRRKREKADI